MLALLAGGMSEADVRAYYSGLTHEDILGAIAYGADRERARDPGSGGTGRVKLKADETVDRSGIKLLGEAGRDVAAVREQGLARAAEESVFGES